MTTTTRMVAPLAAALLGLAGCGGDTCTSNPATATATSGASCSVAAGQPVTFNVSLCAKCSDSSPSCQAEFVGGDIEVAPVVQQCQASQGCAVPGCAAPAPSASCILTGGIPVGTTGPITLHITGDTIVNGQVLIGGSGTTCNL